MGTELLEKNLSELSGWLNIGSCILFVGIFGEYLLLALEKKKDDPAWKKWIKMGLAVMVATGLGMETWFGREQNTVAENIQSESDKKIAELTDDAAKANDRAGAAATRAAEAEKETEDERLTIAKMMSPRVISNAQIDAMRVKLKPFPKQELDIIVVDQGWESRALAIQFSTIMGSQQFTSFRDGKFVPMDGMDWNVRFWRVTTMGVDSPGVKIGTLDKADAKTKAAAEALKSCLFDPDSGWTAWPGMEFSAGPLKSDFNPIQVMPLFPSPNLKWDDKKAAPIRMTIGSKGW